MLVKDLIEILEKQLPNAEVLILNSNAVHLVRRTIVSKDEFWIELGEMAPPK